MMGKANALRTLTLEGAPIVSAPSSLRRGRQDTALYALVYSERFTVIEMFGDQGIRGVR